MSLKSSLPQDAKSVSVALTPDTSEGVRLGLAKMLLTKAEGASLEMAERIAHYQRLRLPLKVSRFLL